MLYVAAAITYYTVVYAADAPLEWVEVDASIAPVSHKNAQQGVGTNAESKVST
jgi:hypothetical protein